MKDIDLERQQLTIRQGKGDRDRVTVLPLCLIPDIERQLTHCRAVYESDRENNATGVQMPNAMNRKEPKSAESWEWFWVSRSMGSSGGFLWVWGLMAVNLAGRFGETSLPIHGELLCDSWWEITTLESVKSVESVVETRFIVLVFSVVSLFSRWEFFIGACIGLMKPRHGRQANACHRAVSSHAQSRGVLSFRREFTGNYS